MRAEMWEERAEAIRECAAEGLNQRQISERVGLTTNTVRNYLRKFKISTEKTIDRYLAALGEAQEKDLTLQEAVAKFGLAYGTLCRVAREYGVVLRHPMAKDPTPNRSEAMAALYLAGYTLERIGEMYGLTRERVRQIIKKRKGLTGKDGGALKQVEANREARRQKKEAKCLARWGCTVAQYKSVREIERQMLAEGKGIYQTPIRAFTNQRNNAHQRQIEWRMTFWQWWNVWQVSGHWNERGREGTNYVMCRTGDEGPYAPDNVFIAQACVNCSEKKTKKSGLPIGVRFIKRGNYETYIASRMVGGKKLSLGTFKTPELAHAAYLMAAPASGVAA